MEDQGVAEARLYRDVRLLDEHTRCWRCCTRLRGSGRGGDRSICICILMLIVIPMISVAILGQRNFVCIQLSYINQSSSICIVIVIVITRSPYSPSSVAQLEPLGALLLVLDRRCRLHTRDSERHDIRARPTRASACFYGVHVRYSTIPTYSVCGAWHLSNWRTNTSLSASCTPPIESPSLDETWNSSHAANR
ncbi:hypothetical protein BC834DRAFT_275936 [Gloeopeniophorella convolvens]|nr:hypothetical protein BC834DRAFT_275936 [Gloeopeniophorella convolvens]